MSQGIFHIASILIYQGIDHWTKLCYLHGIMDCNGSEPLENLRCVTSCPHPIHIHIHKESLMAKWLVQASQWQEMYCHDLEVMSSNPSRIKLGVHSASVLSHRPTWSKNICLSFSLSITTVHIIHYLSLFSTFVLLRFRKYAIRERKHTLHKQTLFPFPVLLTFPVNIWILLPVVCYADVVKTQLSWKGSLCTVYCLNMDQILECGPMHLKYCLAYIVLHWASIRKKDINYKRNKQRK